MPILFLPHITGYYLSTDYPTPHTPITTDSYWPWITNNSLLPSVRNFSYYITLTVIKTFSGVVYYDYIYRNNKLGITTGLGAKDVEGWHKCRCGSCDLKTLFTPSLSPHHSLTPSLFPSISPSFMSRSLSPHANLHTMSLDPSHSFNPLSSTRTILLNTYHSSC